MEPTEKNELLQEIGSKKNLCCMHLKGLTDMRAVIFKGLLSYTPDEWKSALDEVNRQVEEQILGCTHVINKLDRLEIETLGKQD